MSEKYINHPLFKQNHIEKRAYQTNITKTCIGQSTLVVLPTGMGKTIISLLVIVSRLGEGEGKILFLAPTKPLVEQHAGFLRDALLIDKINIFTGEVAPKKRIELWKENRIIVSTPQVIENDIISGNIDLKDVSLIIFDEAHRAVGNYSYVFIAERYKQCNGLVLGITASPGSDAETILSVCKALNVSNVEIRSEHDPDVMPYVHDIAARWISVEIPESMRKIIALLDSALEDRLKDLRSFGLIKPKGRVSTREILDAQRRIQARIRAGGPKPTQSLYHAASIQAAAIKINHAIELAETQGASALKNYFERLIAEANSKHASKAAKTVSQDPKILSAIELTNTTSFEHPKLERVVGVVSEQLRIKKDSRIIVFTHYRNTSELVVETLNKVRDVRAVRFVGQATKDKDIGLSQKEQVEIIQKFKDGEYNVLVATAVAEEGLDIPSTDLVLFYEPVPSEIRTIQRRGRTGRKKPGKMVVLIAKRTRDEAYYWSSRNKESKMKSTLHLLRNELKDKINIGEPPSEEEIDDMKTKKQTSAPTRDVRVSHDIDIDVGVAENISEKKGKKEIQTTLIGFAGIEKPRENLQKPVKQESVAIPQTKNPLAERQQMPTKSIKDSLDTEELVEPVSKGAVPEIIVDTREFVSGVARELSNLGLIVHPRQLSTGDYVLSERICVERKETNDFLQSIIDGRLFSQVLALKRAYLRPILLIEGEDLFTARQISQTAIYGALASVVSDFNIPIFFTKDEKETALFLATISKQELKEGRVAKVRGEKGAMSMRERQQFILEGLPNVSATLAQRLLSHFGNIGAIFNASVEQLCEVKGVGKKTAEEIRKIVDEKYIG